MKLLQAPAPPMRRIASRALTISGWSTAAPVSLRAKYPFTDVLTQAGPPG